MRALLGRRAWLLGDAAAQAGEGGSAPSEPVHDGRYRYDGSIGHSGARPFYTGVFHSGPVTTDLTAY